LYTAQKGEGPPKRDRIASSEKGEGPPKRAFSSGAAGAAAPGSDLELLEEVLAQLRVEAVLGQAVVDGLRVAARLDQPVRLELYETNAAAYLERLDALEQEVKAAIGKIPAERRKVITTHDAFGYFAAAYGVEFIAPEGVSTDTEPSARDVAKIITQIRKQKIPAVFLENITDPRLMQQIARESGAKIGGTLYSDSLSEPGGPAGTYIDMMRSNARALSAALAL
jgi:zinc/manganese transport system substrate-binding protein